MGPPASGPSGQPRLDALPPPDPTLGCLAVCVALPGSPRFRSRLPVIPGNRRSSGRRPFTESFEPRSQFGTLSRRAPAPPNFSRPFCARRPHRLGLPQQRCHTPSHTDTLFFPRIELHSFKVFRPASASTPSGDAHVLHFPHPLAFATGTPPRNPLFRRLRTRPPRVSSHTVEVRPATSSVTDCPCLKLYCRGLACDVFGHGQLPRLKPYWRSLVTATFISHSRDPYLLRAWDPISLARGQPASRLLRPRGKQPWTRSGDLAGSETSGAASA